MPPNRFMFSPCYAVAPTRFPALKIKRPLTCALPTTLGGACFDAEIPKSRSAAAYCITARQALARPTVHRNVDGETCDSILILQVCSDDDNRLVYLQIDCQDSDSPVTGRETNSHGDSGSKRSESGRGCQLFYPRIKLTELQAVGQPANRRTARPVA